MFSRLVFAIDSHTMGEPTRVVVGGMPSIPGDTMFAKKEYLKVYHDDLRKSLMHEPRGHRDMFGSFLLQACHPEADLGIVFMDGGGYLNMCGHGTIGAVTVAIETGMVKITPDKKSVILDTPAGLIEAIPKIEDKKVVQVSFKNVPSFVFCENIKIFVDGLGELFVDIAFGGSFFAILPAEAVNLEIERYNSSRFIEYGLKIKNAVNNTIKVKHPINHEIDTVDLVEFYEEKEGVIKNAVVFGDGQIDRSPCGTGTCAKMALLWSRGQLKKGCKSIHESIIGTRFTGRIVEETKVGEFAAIIPEVSGQAFITGYNQLVIHSDDPLKGGFLI